MKECSPADVFDVGHKGEGAAQDDLGVVFL